MQEAIVKNQNELRQVLAGVAETDQTKAKSDDLKRQVRAGLQKV